MLKSRTQNRVVRFEHNQTRVSKIDKIHKLMKNMKYLKIQKNVKILENRQNSQKTSKIGKKCPKGSKRPKKPKNGHFWTSRRGFLRWLLSWLGKAPPYTVVPIKMCTLLMVQTPIIFDLLKKNPREVIGFNIGFGGGRTTLFLTPFFQLFFSKIRVRTPKKAQKARVFDPNMPPKTP